MVHKGLWKPDFHHQLPVSHRYCSHWGKTEWASLSYVPYRLSTKLADGFCMWQSHVERVAGGFSSMFSGSVHSCIWNISQLPASTHILFHLVPFAALPPHYISISDWRHAGSTACNAFRLLDKSGSTELGTSSFSTNGQKYCSDVSLLRIVITDIAVREGFAIIGSI